MKKLLVFMILFLGMALMVDLLARTNPVDEFANQHKDSKGSFNLDIGTSFLKDHEGDESLFEKVDNVRILTFDKDGGKYWGMDIKKLQKNLKKKGFENYMKIKDDDTMVGLYALEKKKTISDWVMLVDGKETIFLLEIKGRFDYDDLEKIGAELEIDEAKYIND